MTHDLLAIARGWAAEPARWPVQPRFDPIDRWYARLATAPGHEAWLLTWLPGQHTELHDHGGSAGAFVVVAGALVEQTASGRRLREAALPAGAHRRFGVHHVHAVADRGDTGSPPTPRRPARRAAQRAATTARPLIEEVSWLSCPDLS